MKRLTFSRLFAPLFALACASLHASEDVANWPRWRGPNDDGSLARGHGTPHWNIQKPNWKAPLPGKGCSTPIVWKDRIYLTAPVEDVDAALAFDLAGKPLWRTTFGPQDAGKHRNGSGSNPSPATDGNGLYVYFKSGTLAALDFDGKVRWQLNLVEKFGRESLYWDQGTSPVLSRDYVIMARMHGGDSWLAAFDKATGALKWKAARNYKVPTEVDHGYTTPILLEQNGKEALLVWGAQHLTAHDTVSGAELWSCGGFNPDSNKLWPAVASPVVVDGVTVVPFGRADRGQPRLHGVRLGGKGDVTATHRLWVRDDVGTFVPTPAVENGRVYIVRDRGQVDCIDPKSGRTLWSDELPRSSSNYYASPLVANGRLYAIREDGVMFVAGVADKFELLAEADLGERIIASPVPSPSGLLVRGEEHLICLAAN